METAEIRGGGVSVTSEFARSPRFESLDGLRGIAALVVVVFHSSLGLPGPNASEYSGTLGDLIQFTPIHVLLQGGEAVHVFFVLSGFTLPLLLRRMKPLSWRYLASRSLRLYLPAWIALTVYIESAYALAYFQELDLNLGSPIKILRDYLLVFGPEPGTQVILGALWSLAFEIIFSVTIFIWQRLLLKGSVVLWISLLIALITLGDAVNSGLMQYLPMFVIGMVLNRSRTQFQDFVTQIRSRVDGVWLTLITVVLLSATYIAKPMLPLIIGHSESDNDRIKIFFYLPEFVGICLLIGLVLWDPTWRTLFSSPVFRWLGKVSFSLYLSHQTVLLVLDLLPITQPFDFLAKVSVSIVAAQFFYMLFERRAHEFARKIAKSP